MHGLYTCFHPLYIQRVVEGTNHQPGRVSSADDWSISRGFGCDRAFKVLRAESGTAGMLSLDMLDMWRTFGDQRMLPDFCRDLDYLQPMIF